MKNTLHKLMKQGLQDYATSERKQWVLTHYGQVVATVAQIMWSSTTEMYINDMSTNPDALNEWKEVNVKQLKELTFLVRGQLTSL